MIAFQRLSNDNHLSTLKKTKRSNISNNVRPFSINDW